MNEVHFTADVAFFNDYIEMNRLRHNFDRIKMNTDIDEVVMSDSWSDRTLVQVKLKSKTLTIAIPSKSVIRRQFQEIVLPHWRKLLSEKGIPLREMDRNITWKCAENALIRFHTFFHQRRIFDLYSEKWTEKDWSLLLGLPLMRPQNQTPIIILAGIPGSGRHLLINSLRSLAAEDAQWRVVEVPTNERFDPTTLHAHLSSIAFLSAPNSQGRRHITFGSGKKLRLIVLTPGYASVKETISAIENHPNLLVRDRFSIASVTSCIHVENAFAENWTMYPHLLENCAMGLTHNVVLFGKPEQMDVIQSFIRSANPDVNFIRASASGRVYRDDDIVEITSTDWFYQPNVHKKRLLTTAVSQKSNNFGYVSIHLRMCVRLDRSLFMENLDKLTQSPIHRMKARVCFTDAPTTLVEIQSLNGVLQFGSSPIPIPPSESQDEHHSTFQFHGLGIDRDELKSILRQCVTETSTNFMGQKEKLHLHELTEHEMERILDQRLSDPLPSDWFYNGRLFIHVDGSISDRRPNWKEVVERHLTERRAAALQEIENIKRMFIEDQ